jgi:BolA protein
MAGSTPSETATERRARIERALRDAFAPAHLEVIDQSHRHRGHAGAAGGGGHFDVVIVSARFAGSARLARHRMVYDALGPAMAEAIHALAIRALTPEEWERASA